MSPSRIRNRDAIKSDQVSLSPGSVHPMQWICGCNGHDSQIGLMWGRRSCTNPNRLGRVSVFLEAERLETRQSPFTSLVNLSSSSVPAQRVYCLFSSSQFSRNRLSLHALHLGVVPYLADSHGKVYALSSAKRPTLQHGLAANRLRSTGRYGVVLDAGSSVSRVYP
jgi:hypothetical protein